MTSKQRTRRKPRTLLVLGAGASIAAQRYPVRSSVDEAFPFMPSSANFFDDLFRPGKRRGRHALPLNMLRMMYGGTEDLIRRAWGRSDDERFTPEEWRGVNIEDVLTFLDIGARMYSRGSSYSKAFRISRESLLQFIVMMIVTRSHGQHCELLMDLLFTLRPSDTIISFNYDTIADFTVQQAARAQYANYARLMSGSLPHVRTYEKKGLLLKLHGSVNWQTCRSRSCRFHRRPHIPFASARHTLPGEWSGVFGPCRGCGDDRPVPAIIPPMSEKNLARHDFFHRLWLIARAQLPRFDQIVFIGYSFPPNDAYTEWLFRQLRFIDRPLPRVIVANPEAIKRRSIVRGRYESVFSGFDVTYYRDFAALQELWRYPDWRPPS